ncbi:cytochrome P450 [Novosphingobium sp. JCM 18896]|uniref:cytochrome P450 n=1 Tax=Novosphingobium sp. JCM 18896 TaxID=2989731 RepID=UPI002221DEB0|nr:cytochrome P450 [Novosphingobium sp. JCM 18896]MCW1432325.1 cytochrome P450 [Novosphingobium sp. JCM 18896]
MELVGDRLAGSDRPLEYDPLDPVVKHEPYPYYVELRRSEPIKWLPSLNAFCVATYDDVDTVLKDGRTFSSAQFWPELLGEFDPMPEELPMISMDPPGHVQLRKLANKAFVPSRIAQLKDRTYKISHELIDDIIAKHGTEGEFDWAWEFTALYPVTVIAEVLGVPTQRRAEFKVWVDKILSAANRAAYEADQLAGIAEASEKMRAFFEELFDERAANLGDDLISTLIQAEVDGKKMTRNQVLSMAILLLIGGVETTTNLLGTTLVELKRHPEVYRRVRADHSLIAPLLEEVLRYNPPVQIIFRHTTADTELGGVKIPAGSAVMPILASANRDETKFNDPETFDIDRKIDVPLMSFGQGPHFCLGSYLSRMEAKSALEVAFTRFAELDVIDDHIHWLDSYFARGPHTLPVRFKAA